MIGVRGLKLCAAVVWIVVGLIGCVSSNTEKIADEEGTAAQEMPAGHPEVALPTGPTDSAKGLTWDVAEAFVRVPPANTMRIAQYRLPGPEDEEEDGELAVFHFGPGVGGSTEANLSRWAGQFHQADGSDPMTKAKTETFESSGGFSVTTIEVTGHYVSSNMGSGPSYDQEGWALYGAVVEGEGGPWFFKAVGPVGVLQHFHVELDGLYRAVRAASM